MLIVVSQNFEQDKGCVWGMTGYVCGMTMRMIKPMKFYTRSKLKDGSATDKLLLLASQKSEENQR